MLGGEYWAVAGVCGRIRGNGSKGNSGSITSGEGRVGEGGAMEEARRQADQG